MPDPRPDYLTWRHRVAVAALALAFVGLVARVAQIQIIDHERYAEQAAFTHYGAVSVPAPRGAIIDATGYPLAISVDTWDIYVDSRLWQDSGRAREAAARLATALALDPGAVLATGTAQREGDVLVRRRVPYEQGLALREQGLWGVRALPSSVRLYPEGDLAGPLLGYVGLDGEGLWGIELDYDHMLQGRPGRVATERDPLGRPIAFARRVERPASVGAEVHLTIDRSIQAIAERHLAAAIEEHQAPSGSIVVMDPLTGAVLALASQPAVALSSLDLDDPELASLVRNRPVTDLYEPGSVFKTLTTAAAIDLGRVTPQSTYVDEGKVEVGGYEIKNWDLRAYGEVTVTEFLQYSINTGAVWLSREIGARDFYEYLAAFGIGKQTHLGLSGEAEGIVRTPDDDGWYPVDLATNAFGQGLAATPLQVLTAVNVFANGGMLMRPYVVSKVVAAGETREFDPVEIRRVVSPGTARTVARLMLDVVEGVPRHGALVPGYRVAGKTGTTIVSIPTGYDFDITIASFAGFVPYEAPRVSILVKIDQPAGERNLGGEVAAPLFSRVAADIMEYLNVPTSDRRVLAR